MLFILDEHHTEIIDVLGIEQVRSFVRDRVKTDTWDAIIEVKKYD